MPRLAAAFHKKTDTSFRKKTDVVQACYEQGMHKLEQKQYTEAITDFDRGLMTIERLRPTRTFSRLSKIWDMYGGRGWSKIALGLYREGVEDFNRYYEATYPDGFSQLWLIALHGDCLSHRISMGRIESLAQPGVKLAWCINSNSYDFRYSDRWVSMEAGCQDLQYFMMVTWTEHSRDVTADRIYHYTDHYPYAVAAMTGVNLIWFPFVGPNIFQDGSSIISNALEKECGLSFEKMERLQGELSSFSEPSYTLAKRL